MPWRVLTSASLARSSWDRGGTVAPGSLSVTGAIVAAVVGGLGLLQLRATRS